MKRSEMIQFLITHFSTEPDKIFYSYADIAEAALEGVEKAGMLPPDNGKEAYDVLDYRYKCLKWDEE